jgi:hypothetical protein
MKLHSLRPAVVAATLALAGTVQGAVMLPPVTPDAQGWFTITDSTGPHAPVNYTLKIDPTTAPMPVIYYDTNPPASQDPSAIANLMAPWFGADPSTLSLSSQCDNISGTCADATAAGNEFSIQHASFDYLALHFGGGELFFHWAAPQTLVKLTTPDAFPGLSDYRAYMGPLAAPLPGALGLFLSALGLLGLGRRFARPAGAEAIPA